MKSRTRARRGASVSAWARALASALACATAWSLVSCAPKHSAPAAENITLAPSSAPHVPAVIRDESAPIAPIEPTAPTAATEQAPPRTVIQVTPLITVDREAHRVELTAVTVLDVGFLEQLVCLVSTREHESLFAFEGTASEVHAALLLAGFLPGAPGHWREVANASGDPVGNTVLEGVAPTGSNVVVEVRLDDGSTHSIDWFVRAAPWANAPDAHPPQHFRFGGSRFHRDARSGIERYVADGSGSLIGLVTFGDEVIGCVEVISDEASVAQPLWEVHSERMPALGSRVTVVLTLVAAAEPPPLAGGAGTK